MKPEKKVSNEVCAELNGVGRSTVSAVRKMLGIPSSTRKVFASAVGKFLQSYHDFEICDAKDSSSMVAFKKRHPKFELPT